MPDVEDVKHLLEGAGLFFVSEETLGDDVHKVIFSAPRQYNLFKGQCPQELGRRKTLEHLRR